MLPFGFLLLFLLETKSVVAKSSIIETDYVRVGRQATIQHHAPRLASIARVAVAVEHNWTLVTAQQMRDEALLPQEARLATGKLRLNNRFRSKVPARNKHGRGAPALRSCSVGVVSPC